MISPVTGCSIKCMLIGVGVAELLTRVVLPFLFSVDVPDGFRSLRAGFATLGIPLGGALLGGVIDHLRHSKKRPSATNDVRAQAQPQPVASCSILKSLIDCKEVHAYHKWSDEFYDFYKITKEVQKRENSWKGVYVITPVKLSNDIVCTEEDLRSIVAIQKGPFYVESPQNESWQFVDGKIQFEESPGFSPRPWASFHIRTS